LLRDAATARDRWPDGDGLFRRTRARSIVSFPALLLSPFFGVIDGPSIVYYVGARLPKFNIKGRVIMKIETMEDLFVEQIEDLYDAEQRLVKALPKMAEASTSPELRHAFESHLDETRGHVTRLEQVFLALRKKPKSQTCDAMKGLIEEGEDMISNTDQSPVRDAGLIAAANRVEHYEIAAYGTVRTLAKALGVNEAVGLLDATLTEEKKADEKLTRLAETSVNRDALRGAAVSR
jgi:ferritin-like metal-binding protein YciE